VALKPGRLSFAQAASCGVPYVTAWHALAGVEKATRLLVIGAAGAVGVAATHLARLRGAEVTGAVRRTEQASLLEQRGFQSILLEQGQPIQGAWDMVFDTTGHWLAAAIGALERFGRAAVIVAPGDGRQNLPIRDLYRRGASIAGVNSLLYSCIDCARLLRELAPHFESGALRSPDGLEERALERALEAYAALKAGYKGKLVLVT
jgi:NADPH:quinone reductase-like Zn-dependent oxidoreductase